MTFPVDWNEFREQWSEWKHEHPELKTAHVSFGPKNFMADEVLGIYSVGDDFVELSEVTMPDFSQGYGGDRNRFIGITFKEGDELVSGGVVDSFGALEEVLGIVVNR